MAALAASLMRALRLVDAPHLALALIALLLQRAAERTPVHPLFAPPNDPSLMYPRAASQAFAYRTLQRALFAAAACALLALFSLSRLFPRAFRPFNFFTALWLCLVSVGVTSAFCAFFKSFVGRPRPDTYAVCGLNTTHATCAARRPDKQYISWPSSHAAHAVSYCAFLALFAQRAIRARCAALDAIGVGALFFGVYVSATRVRDHRHHPDDVTAGILLGALIPHFLWRTHRRILFPRTRAPAPERIDVALSGSASSQSDLM